MDIALGKLKSFYYIVGIKQINQADKKAQTYLGRFTSSKTADEEITKAKIITMGNKADAEFVINISLN